MELPTLNFNRKYDFKFTKKLDQFYIFDVVRKSFYLLTPEEWVRQHVIHHLIYEKKIPKINLAIEKIVEINDMNKRLDVCVYKKGIPYLITECKAPEVKITQETFDQVMRYNLIVNAPFIMITNGLNHIYAKLDIENKKYEFLTDIPF